MHDSEYTTIIRELKEKIEHLECALQVRKGTIDILQDIVNRYLADAKARKECKC